MRSVSSLWSARFRMSARRSSSRSKRSAIALVTVTSRKVWHSPQRRSIHQASGVTGSQSTGFTKSLPQNAQRSTAVSASERRDGGRQDSARESQLRSGGGSTSPSIGGRNHFLQSVPPKGGVRSTVRQPVQQRPG